SAKRSLEVGVRKVFGADRGSLFRQFISESVLIVIISFILAIILFNLALPGFNALSGNNFTADVLLEGNSLLFLIAVVVFVGFLAGSYPALFLSRFKPITVLKGIFYSGNKKSVFRNLMVIIQFVISVFLVAGTLLIYRQLNYIQNKDLGIEKENIVVVALRNRSMIEHYKTLKAEIQNLPGVLEATGSSAYLGNFQQRMGFFPEGGDINNMVLTLYMQVDQNYLEMFNANIAMGRNFFENSIADSNAIIINKSYAEELGWENPLGKNIFIPGDETVEDYPLKIVGVVENFNYASLHEDVKPLIIMNSPERVRYLSLKINPKDQQQVLELISAKWEELYPDYPFEYFMQKAKYDNMYISDVNMGRLFIYFTILAIFIAALGLFGLSSYTAEQRTKEIGIRKVLGSSVSQILILISKEFSKLVIIAIVVAIPVSWFGINKWLQNFAFQTNISWWIFIVSGIVAIIITYLTIIFQALKASRTNPVEALKYE
ncbi:MAG: FtsX-like permease family protein, partial [Bacteroidales bacterium]|nr:FtsX-like permease family protein [Bacteroidales bacterium]